MERLIFIIALLAVSISSDAQRSWDEWYNSIAIKSSVTTVQDPDGSASQIDIEMHHRGIECCLTKLVDIKPQSWMNMEQVFETIEQHSFPCRVTFAYPYNAVNRYPHVKMPSGTKSIIGYLDAILEGTDLTYEILARDIVLIKRR